MVSEHTIEQALIIVTTVSTLDSLRTLLEMRDRKESEYCREFQ